MRDIHTDTVLRIVGRPDEPFTGRQLCLLGHGSDLGGIVVNIFDDIVYKFHCYLLVRWRHDRGAVVFYVIGCSGLI